MDRPTAASTPYSTPKTSTEMVLASAIASSERRKRAKRRNSATSIRRSAANTTRAPRAAIGNVDRTGPATRSTASTAMIDTIELSWLRLPSESPITVRLPLLLTGKPWKRPDATFAAPSASISWSASTG
jgi:hypothetical protein